MACCFLVEPKSRKSELKVHSPLHPALEAKIQDLKAELIEKIDQELSNAIDAKDCITQKYNDLDKKIKRLSEIHSNVAGFRTDVKCIENHIAELSMRIGNIERKPYLESGEGANIKNSYLDLDK